MSRINTKDSRLRFCRFTFVQNHHGEPVMILCVAFLNRSVNKKTLSLPLPKANETKFCEATGKGLGGLTLPFPLIGREKRVRREPVPSLGEGE